ncbi:hypothetical protein F5Y16DRAFT_165035 [Xylariaceae sp. FL0255]|nr:hypothetical protein F5Y16DRAFT_165035 [Xylariaceae sp. FL0255]
MPYLDYQPISFLTERKNDTFFDLDNLKHCKTSALKDLGPALEVTLDEFCIPGLDPEALEHRNQDQVVTRYGRRKNKHASDSSLRLITVPQLWCWKIGSKLILSFSDDALKLVLSAVKQDDDPKHIRSTGEEDEDLDMIIGLVLSRLINTLDRPSEISQSPLQLEQFGPRESVFGIFTKSITAVAQEVNEYTQTTADLNSISIEKEMQVLHEINDIREEISMMRIVISQQEDVWKNLVWNMWPEFWPTGETGQFKPPETGQDAKKWREISRPQAQFLKYFKRFAQLDEDCRTS